MNGSLPARSRGVIALLHENCTACMLCAKECPSWCIEIDSHAETVQPEGGGRPRKENVLDRFEIDYGLCMYCSICVDVCPFDALFWAPEHAYAADSRAGLTHDAERLQSWMWVVPPPDALDEHAVEPAEVAQADKARTRAARRSGPS